MPWRVLIFLWLYNGLLLISLFKKKKKRLGIFSGRTFKYEDLFKLLFTISESQLKPFEDVSLPEVTVQLFLSVCATLSHIRDLWMPAITLVSVGQKRLRNGPGREGILASAFSWQGSGFSFLLGSVGGRHPNTSEERTWCARGQTGTNAGLWEMGESPLPQLPSGAVSPAPSFVLRVRAQGNRTKSHPIIKGTEQFGNTRTVGCRKQVLVLRSAGVRGRQAHLSGPQPVPSSLLPRARLWSV